MAEENKAEEVKSGGNKLVLILIIVVVLLLAAVGGVVAMLLMKGDKAPDPAATPVAAEGAPATPAEPVAPPKGAPQYYSFSPAFTVNFMDQSDAHFLQVEVQVLTYHEKAVEVIETHAPRIKNDLIMLFSEQNSRELMTAEGKRKLRDKALEIIREVVKDTDPSLVVDDLYFTSFVMQ